MRISQTDIASLSDDTTRRLAGMYFQIHEEGGPLAAFAHSFSMALIGALRERHRTWLLLEADLMNDDGPGAIVGPE